MKKTALTWTRIAVPAAAAILTLAACSSTTAEDSSSEDATTTATAEVTESEPMEDEPMEETPMEETPMEDQSMDEETKDETAMDEADMADEPMMEMVGSYITYDDYLAGKDMYDASNVVLFFNASWCSTCQEAVNNIEAASDNLPEGLTIVSVDYDSSDEIKRQYGVTTQHTFVQIDADGNELGKWTGSTTADQIAKKTV